MKHLSLSLLALCLTQATISAAIYVAPQCEDTVLIKSDRIPLGTNTIKWLSTYLSNIAEQQSGGTARELRASAKLIAIAEQLDPTNNKLKEAKETLISASKSPQLKPNKVEGDQQRFASIINFLADSESEKQGQILANLTRDALLVIDPENPALKSFHSPSNLWGSTIAKLKKFEYEPELELVSNSRVSHSVLPKIDASKIEKPKRDPKKEPELAKWHSKQLTISAPFSIYYLGDNNQTLYEKGIKKLNVSIQESQLKPGKFIELSSKPTIRNQDRIYYLTSSVEKVLKHQWKAVDPAKITILCDNAYSRTSNHNITSTAVIVALDSSLAGKKLLQNLVVVSSIDDSGKFIVTPGYWASFNNLIENCENSRVLVSPETTGYFKQLIAMEKIDFFINNEIISVVDLLEARAFSCTNESTDIAKANGLFKDVKKALENKSIKSMTENKYVRQKLESILELTPNHLSAKMLLAYGNVKIMPPLESKYLGLELADILSKSKSFVDTRNNYISSKDSLNESEVIDQRLDLISKFVAKSDQPIFDQASKFSDQLRSLSKSQNNAQNKSSKYYKKAVTTSLRELRSNYNDIQIKLAGLTGVPYKIDE